MKQLKQLLAALAATFAFAALGCDFNWGTTFGQCDEKTPCKRAGEVCGADNLCHPAPAINIQANDGGAPLDAGIVPATDGGQIADGGVTPANDGGPAVADGGAVVDGGGISIADGGAVVEDGGPAVGEEGGRCYGNDTCNERLNCLSGLCVRVGGPAVGEERGPCYGNDTCNAGLTCLSDICVRVPAGDGGPASDGGATPDDGGAVADGGVSAEDGGPTADGGVSVNEDGGAVTDDGGAVADGGVAAEDGGPAEDGGTLPEDGGPIADGGVTVAEDGGAFTDGGTTVTEDGGPTEDGGSTSDGGLADDGGAFVDGGVSINEDGGAAVDGGPSVAEDGGVSLDGGTLSDGGLTVDGGVTLDAGMTCVDGLSLCETTCTDLQKDLLNCGVCGRACADTDNCINGSCVLAPCGRGVRDGDVVVKVTLPFGMRGSKVVIRDGNAPGMSYCIFDYIPGATFTCIMPFNVEYVQGASGDCATGTSCTQLAEEYDWFCNCVSSISDGGLVLDGGTLTDGGMVCWIDGTLVARRCVSDTLVSEDWPAQMTSTGANCVLTVVPDGGVSVDGGMSVTEDGGVSVDGGTLTCPDGMVDEGGECICLNHLSICDGICTDLQNDTNNCGSCGRSCPSALYACEAGACVENQCEPGVYVGSRVFELTSPAGMQGAYLVIRASDGSHSCVDPYVAGSVMQCVMPTTVDVAQVASGDCSSGTTSCVQLAIERTWICNCWDSANPDGGYTPIDGGNLVCRTDAVLRSRDCLPGGTYSPWQLWTSAWTPAYNGANCVPAP